MSNASGTRLPPFPLCCRYPQPSSLPGVSVKKGQDVVNIFAPIIISDAGIFNTYERLLPPEARALPGKSPRCSAGFNWD